MDIKGTLKAITLELRRGLEGKYDAQGTWQPGDLERRLAAIGVRRGRAPVPVDELPHLAPEDRVARRVVDAFLLSRAEAGQNREAAIAEFVRDAAYTWANRLLALRCMEARELIDEVILQKDAYGGRSLQHNRLANKQPERCAGEDEGLFAALFDEFFRRAAELPLLFNPRAPEVALRPSVAALKRCVALLSGTLAMKGQEAATDEVFTAPDTLGWTYQYWNTEEKDRVFEKVRTKKGAKVEGSEIIPATCIYTEPYMVKFLVQNSLGAIWMGMHAGSRLCEGWEYFVRDADHATVSKKAVSEITFLDPACGSGHFLIEAFELFYAMYAEEGVITDAAQICASILERNLYGIDIDGRAVQIAALALVMKAKEKAPDFLPRRVNLVATNIRLPAKGDHLEAFLARHPEDAPLKPALLSIFEALAHADELGSLLQIEEPVDHELRHLREQQLARERKAGAASLFGPHNDEDWSNWKHDAIERLRQHFSAEAQDSDLASSFFSEAASKGLSLADLLARRYDIVAANPPYMGSKNMGNIVKQYVECSFPGGKRDLYAAFILRARQLAVKHGQVAMITQHSWMFLSGFIGVRKAVLAEDRIRVLAHLGPRTFSELSNTNALGFCMFSLNRGRQDNHNGSFLRLVHVCGEEKDKQLRAVLDAHRSGKLQVAGQWFTVDNRLFETVPESAIFYWAPKAIQDAFLTGRTIHEYLEAKQGLITGDNDRFLRCFWEVKDPGWIKYAKGGPYRRWFGNIWLVVDWRQEGTAIKNFILPSGRQKSRPQNIQYYFRAGCTWTAQSSYGFSVRLLPAGCIFAAKGPAFFPKAEGDDLSPWLALANSQVFEFIFNAIQPVVDYGEGYFMSIPAPSLAGETLHALGGLARIAAGLKEELTALDPCESWFSSISLRPNGAPTIVDAASAICQHREARECLIHACEGAIHYLAAGAYRLAATDLEALRSECGTPAGCLPLLEGYDALPDLPTGSVHPLSLNTIQRHRLEREEVAAVKGRLRSLYEAGPENLGGDAVADDETAGDGDEPGFEGAVVAETAQRVPAETFLEKLAQEFGVHPVSVYSLLQELRKSKGLVGLWNVRRFVEDYLGVAVLQLFGYRWPRDTESGTAVSVGTDADGVIPLSDDAEQPSLLSRLRDVIARDFIVSAASSIEREFHKTMGKALAEWLVSDFFKVHTSRFKKRPLLWHIQSRTVSGKRRGRGLTKTAPVFSCVVYYQRLDADLPPKLRTQYVGPLRTRFQTELGSLEKLRDRSADQDARRLELEGKLEELKAFDARIEQVITDGFASVALDKIAAKEPLDKWTSRDGLAPAPETREAFLAQEQRYDPDLNDGVRVNIAPLQRAGLLAADVLASKDIEKAIADRAEWHADERRWCREGKLPRPGWWKEERR